MLPGLRKPAIAARLLLAGDFPELLNRIRVALLGNRSIAFPALPVVDAGPGSASNSRRHGAVGVATDGPVRCLMFAHNLNFEGAPVSQFELTRALTERGVVVPQVIAFEDGPLRAAYADAGIPVTVVRSCLGRVATLHRLQRVVDEIAGIISTSHVDVVYANTLLAFVPVLAAHQTGIPSIWNVRESEPWETSFGFLGAPIAQEALVAMTLPYRVVFVAEATRRIWSRFDVRGNFTVIRNGLDLRGLRAADGAGAREKRRRELGYRSDDVVFLCVGTVCERKGQRDLVRAFAALPRDLAMSSRLCFVGDVEPRYMRLLRRDIAGLSADRRGQIAFHQATPDIQAFYAAADAFVLCSRLESYPRVILEAMAHGLPVLAAPVFGVREQLGDGEDALFFEPGDVAALADHMRLMARNPRERARMASASNTRFATLTGFEDMVAAYRDVFIGARCSVAP